MKKIVNNIDWHLVMKTLFRFIVGFIIGYYVIGGLIEQLLNI